MCNFAEYHWALVSSSPGFWWPYPFTSVSAFCSTQARASHATCSIRLELPFSVTSLYEWSSTTPHASKAPLQSSCKGFTIISTTYVSNKHNKHIIACLAPVVTCLFQPKLWHVGCWNHRQTTLWNLRTYPLVELRQTVPCQAIRGNSISVNGTLPPSSICLRTVHGHHIWFYIIVYYTIL